MLSECQKDVPNLLGQIIVNDNGVLAVVTEVLSHGGTGEGSEVLKRTLRIC